MISTTTHPLTLAEHAEAAYEAVRAINHATRAAVLPAPDVYAVLGSLNPVGPGLAQACTQLASALIRSLDVYDVREDDGGDPATSALTAQYHLAQAAGLAHQLGTHLTHAHNAISGQGHRGPCSSAEDNGHNGGVDGGVDQGDPVLW